MFQKIKNVYHLFVAILGNFLFLFPSRKLTVIGVTGTDGKTTTANIIYHILNSSGKKAALISSLGFFYDGRKEDIGFHVTTPSPINLQYLIYKIIRKKRKYLVLEVTSHAIDQHRIFGIPFEIGVITNVTYEHLDYHKTYDNYLKTKAKLIDKAKTAVVNRDDGSYTFLANHEGRKDPENWITYGFSESADFNIKNFLFKTKLIGDFNKYNCLAAASVCKKLGIKDSDIKKALASYNNPVGRADLYYSKDYHVIVDFAHTPNSFEQILKGVRPMFKGKLIHVFGSAGKRDSSKRPMMGEISSKFSDVVIITAEDPRGEDVMKISSEIESGMDSSMCQIIKIPDRKEAIQTAINMARKNDIVLITGKAHEKSMNYDGREVLWNEYEVIDKAIANKQYEK
jgi:UDP-N-acetylmuramoyl-L-alanyl-D-glutamate--2,6-diaminopimelate ligase